MPDAVALDGDPCECDLEPVTRASQQSLRLADDPVNRHDDRSAPDRLEAAPGELEQERARTACSRTRRAVPGASNRVAAVRGLDDRLCVLRRCYAIRADVVEATLPDDVSGPIELGREH